MKKKGQVAGPREGRLVPEPTTQTQAYAKVRLPSSLAGENIVLSLQSMQIFQPEYFSSSAPEKGGGGHTQLIFENRGGMKSIVLGRLSTTRRGIVKCRPHYVHFWHMLKPTGPCQAMAKLKVSAAFDLVDKM